MMNDATAMQVLIGAVIFGVVLVDRLMPHRCKDCQRRHEEEYNRRCQAHYAVFRPPVPSTGSGVRPPSNFIPTTMARPPRSPPPKPRK